MSWIAIGVLAVGAYGLKVFGVMVLGRVSGGVAARVEPLTALIPAALFSALIAVQTLGGDERLVIDARLWGVGAGAVAVGRRAPFVVGGGVAMATTALVRWQTWI